jgi:hypothetical protein
VREYFKRRRIREEHEVQRSLEIAQQFPMRTHECESGVKSDSEVASEPATSHWIVDSKDRQEQAESLQESMLSFREIVRKIAGAEADPAKVRAAEMSALPPPLTRAVLDKAYGQLGPGAEKSIEACVSAWREDKLGSDEVIKMVRSFAGSSECLSRHLAPLIRSNTGLSEVASPDQMRELQEMLH